MRRCVAALVAVTVLGSCGNRDGLSLEQLQILEAIASDDTGALCLRPRIWGAMSEPWARNPPKGFSDLATRLTEGRRTDIHLVPGTRLGRVLISDRPDCFDALLPAVAGDRAATALLSHGWLLEFGLHRRNGRWIIVERSQPNI